jgi:hypothetical protein
MPPRVPRTSPAAHKREHRAWARPNLGVIIVALTKSLNPRHPQPRCARSLPRGLSPAITHTHGDAQRRRPARRSAVRLPLHPSHPAPAAPWLPLLTNCAPQPAPCATHKRTQHLGSPVGRPVHTEDLASQCHTHPLHPLDSALAPALVTYSTAVRYMDMDMVHTHAQPQSHASAVRHSSHTQSPPALACTTGCARTHALLARAVDAGDAPHAACCRPPCLCPQPLIPPALPRCRS